MRETRAKGPHPCPCDSLACKAGAQSSREYRSAASAIAARSWTWRPCRLRTHVMRYEAMAAFEIRPRAQCADVPGIADAAAGAVRARAVIAARRAAARAERAVWIELRRIL